MPNLPHVLRGPSARPSRRMGVALFLAGVSISSAGPRMAGGGVATWQKELTYSNVLLSPEALAVGADDGPLIGGASIKLFITRHVPWFIKFDASGNPKWSASWPALNGGAGVAIACQDGGYEFGGVESGAAWLGKLDSSGAVSWMHHFSDPFAFASNVASLIPMADGGSIAVGQIAASWVARLDVNGAVLWEHQLGDSTLAFSGVAAGTLGGLVVGGAEPAPASGFFLAALDPGNGSEIWRAAHDFAGLPGQCNAGFVPSADGGYGAYGNCATVTVARGWLVKLDQNGGFLWGRQLSYSSPNFSVRQVLGTDDGGFVVAGTHGGPTTQELRPYVLKLDATGAVVWQRFMDAPGEQAIALARASGGGYIMTAGAGYIDNTVGALPTYLLKLDDTGMLDPSCPPLLQTGAAVVDLSVSTTTFAAGAATAATRDDTIVTPSSQSFTLTSVCGSAPAGCDLAKTPQADLISHAAPWAYTAMCPSSTVNLPGPPYLVSGLAPGDSPIEALAATPAGLDLYQFDCSCTGMLKLYKQPGAPPEIHVVY